MLSQHRRRDSGALIRQDIRLFDFGNGRGSGRDLYSLANNSAKYSGRSSCNPVAKFALGSRHRRPVEFSYRGFVCCFEAAKCPLDRRKAFSCYEVRMRRDRPIRQVVD